MLRAMMAFRTYFLLPLLLLSGCSNVGYYAQAVRGQVSLMWKRQPIEEVLQDKSIDSDLRAQLAQVLEIRDFASSELGLPDNGSYRSYADVGRPYVVWNVFATPEFSVDPETWCFVVVGCVSYRGYFREDRAQRFAAGLDEDGKDVYVAGVTAYSTLGNFDDPVLSTMLYWDDDRLAGLIFHELAHQVLYVKGDTDFSESFASFVEEEGVRRWLIAEGRSDDIPEYEASRARLEAFGELVVRTRERLRIIYSADYADSELRERKRNAFAEMRQEYAAIRAGWGDVLAFDAWFERDLNNAHLASVAAYRRFVPAFATLLRQQDGDLDAFYREVEEIAHKDKSERHRLMLELSGDEPGGPEPVAGL